MPYKSSEEADMAYNRSVIPLAEMCKTCTDMSTTNCDGCTKWHESEFKKGTSMAPKKDNLLSNADDIMNAAQKSTPTKEGIVKAAADKLASMPTGTTTPEGTMTFTRVYTKADPKHVRSMDLTPDNPLAVNGFTKWFFIPWTRPAANRPYAAVVGVCNPSTQEEMFLVFQSWSNRVSFENGRIAMQDDAAAKLESGKVQLKAKWDSQAKGYKMYNEKPVTRRGFVTSPEGGHSAFFSAAMRAIFQHANVLFRALNEKAEQEVQAEVAALVADL